MSAPNLYYLQAVCLLALVASVATSAPALGQQKPLSTSASQPMGYAATAPADSRLTLTRADISQLFTRKAEDAIRLSVSTENGRMHPLEGRVLSHLNPGPTSGFIVAQVSLDGHPFKMLLSRKDRENGLDYTLSLLPPQGNYAYRLETQGDKEFTLVLGSRESVVSE